jgi:putative transposase
LASREGDVLLTRKDDDQAVRLERARAIGLFRYMLIREAADPSLTGRQRGAMVRAAAAVPHTDPEGRTVRISRWTLDRWIQDWRKGGFDALVPSPRQSQPRTPPEVMELAAALKKENPDRTAAQVKRIMEAQHGWAPDERTLQRMFTRTGLTALRAPAEPAVFGRFECLCVYTHNASYAEDWVMRTAAPDVVGDQGFRRRRLTGYGIFTGSRGMRERGQAAGSGPVAYPAVRSWRAPAP